MISLIASIGKNNEIGKNNQLIFNLKDDLKFFKQTTSEHQIVMGRKTWESLPHKLENRKNIVISHHNFPGPDLIIHNFDRFLAENKNTSEEIFIIGGEIIYSLALPYAKRLYLTEIDAEDKSATAFFPKFDQSKYLKQVIKKGQESGLDYTIVKYTKK